MLAIIKKGGPQIYDLGEVRRVHNDYMEFNFFKPHYNTAGEESGEVLERYPRKEISYFACSGKDLRIRVSYQKKSPITYRSVLRVIDEGRYLIIIMQEFNALGKPDGEKEPLLLNKKLEGVTDFVISKQGEEVENGTGA